ncbi:MAG: Smr/MutS family protein [Verrucomicrobiales bacterium]|nr:Smr/MutS family protein [Verrucomicrobiales bacterium]
MDEAADFSEPVPLPITGELDLHVFRPNEIGQLIPDYLAECRARGILQVRIVHGKGTGTLRTTVHRLVERLEGVESWVWPAGTGSGSWGATWVYLRPLEG